MIQLWEVKMGSKCDLYAHSESKIMVKKKRWKPVGRHLKRVQLTKP